MKFNIGDIIHSFDNPIFGNEAYFLLYCTDIKKEYDEYYFTYYIFTKDFKYHHKFDSFVGKDRVKNWIKEYKYVPIKNI